MTEAPIGIYYEHPTWFQPLFEALDQRGVRYERIAAQSHTFDPSIRRSPYSLIVNRVSAYPSETSHPEIILYVKQYLAYLEQIGAEVINGRFAYAVGTSKALQIGIFEQLNLRYPKAHVIHHADQAPAAAATLRFPVVVKPNIGGSGAGIVRFETLQELSRAVGNGTIDLGIDHTALVQEYLPAGNREIIRVEFLGGQFLYAIRLPVLDASFNYCPADGCHITSSSFCPADGGHPKDRIESYEPPGTVIDDVKRIMAASRADLGGVEYLVNASDSQPYYYDINPLSNFIADAPRIVGFDPVSRFVDYILERADRAKKINRFIQSVEAEHRTDR